MQKEKIISDTLLYSSANYIVIIVGFIVSVFSKKFLGVSGAGYWALLTVVLTYGMYIGLGIQNALVREIPQCMGAKDIEKAREIEDVTFSYLIIAGVVGAVAIWILSFFLFTDPLLKTGMKIVAVLVLVTLMYNLIQNILRARKQISILSKVVVINILLVAILALPGAYLFNVNGFAAGMVITTTLSFYFAKRWAGISLSLNLDWAQIWHLIKIGLAMLLASILFRTFLNIDKIMICKMLGIEQLGLYTIGIMAVQQVGSLPGLFSIVIFPHIQEKYGATKDVMDVKNMILKPTYFISRLMPILIGVIIFLAQPLVLFLLPQFKDGLDVMKILVLGYFFMAMNQMSSTLLFTINKQKSLIPLYGVMVAVCIGLNYLFITLGWGITGVALGTSISYFLFFLVVFTFASRHIMEWRKIVRFYFEIMVFYIYFLINILWIDAIVNLPGTILTSSLKISCFLLVCIPVLISVQRRERIFSLIFEAFKSKIYSFRFNGDVVAK
jgi:O-antigen/teichoic acid export membrane protein